MLRRRDSWIINFHLDFLTSFLSFLVNMVMTLKENSFLPNSRNRHQSGHLLGIIFPTDSLLARMEGIALCPPFREGLQVGARQSWGFFRHFWCFFRVGNFWKPHRATLQKSHPKWQNTSFFGGKDMVDTMNKWMHMDALWFIVSLYCWRVEWTIHTLVGLPTPSRTEHGGAESKF